MFGTGLSRRVGDRPTDSGAADSKSVASMFRRVLSHAGLRKVVEGIIAEQFAGRDKSFHVCLPCVRQGTLGIGASSDGQLAWPGRSLRVALWRSSLGCIQCRHQEGHGGQPLQEMSVEGSIAIAGHGVWDFNFGTGL